ncbi:MAG TPA: AAA family ATPase [Thomasclavelia ramosa]|nr:AAA family ATPase [Thomasclavelia ramosa]
MEQILIKNFGPIEEVDIKDIRKVTIFIGESGSGKSTIMKVVSLFRWIYKMVNIRSFLKYSGIKKSPFRFLFINLLKNSSMLGYLKPDTVLEYHNGSCTLTWDPKTKKLKGTSVYIPKEELSLEKISFISDKRNLISDLVDNNTSIKRNMFYPGETYSDFETAVREVKEIDVLNLGVRFTVKKTSQGLKYTIVSETESDGFGIKLNEASSGTQNLVPMNVIVEYYSKYYNLVSSINNAILSYVSRSDSLSDFKAVKNVGEFANKNVHLIIEEPELSLYPSSQRSLMDFLIKNIYGDVQREYNISLMMATHSPYIVNSLNVLLRRGRIENNKQASIKEDDISVFKVYHGRIQNLIAKDSKNGETIVNTMDLSEEMESIFKEYVSLRR